MILELHNSFFLVALTLPFFETARSPVSEGIPGWSVIAGVRVPGLLPLHLCGRGSGLVDNRSDRRHRPDDDDGATFFRVLLFGHRSSRGHKLQDNYAFS
jgi:hypothetical protein